MRRNGDFDPSAVVLPQARSVVFAAVGGRKLVRLAR
jgi:hypothetical protein